MFSARTRCSSSVFPVGKLPDPKSADPADKDARVKELLSCYSLSYALREHSKKEPEHYDKIRALTALQKVIAFFCEGKYFGDHSMNLQVRTIDYSAFPTPQDDKRADLYLSHPSYKEIKELIMSEQCEIKSIPHPTPQSNIYLCQFNAFLFLTEGKHEKCAKEIRPFCHGFSKMVIDNQKCLEKYPSEYKNAIAECEFFWLLFNHCEIRMGHSAATVIEEKTSLFRSPGR